MFERMLNTDLLYSPGVADKKIFSHEHKCSLGLYTPYLVKIIEKGVAPKG